MQRNTEARKETATSDVCRYGECDGTGIIRYTKDGMFYAKRCRCMEDRIAEKRLSFANIPNEFKDLKIKDFETGIYSGGNVRIATLAKNIAVEYVRKYGESEKGLYFYSYIKGSGKTRLAISIGNALMNMYGERVKFVTTVNILNELRDTYFSEGKNQLEMIKDLSDINVLIIDDVGVEKPSDWVNDMFYSIINERMINGKKTIFTSNCPIDELRLDDRIKSRIKRMVLPVKLPEESIRDILAEKENEEILKMLLC